MLTVLLATRNRAPVLNGVLDSYCDLQAPPGGWKLIVVDNGSTDGTLEALRAHAGRLPLDMVQECRPGKNVALNAGLARVEGDLLVLTDDDAFPRPDWLCRLRQAADDNPSLAIFGGAVRARWERPPPEWMLKWVPAGPTFSLTEADVPAGPTGPQNVFGPNMTVRTSVLANGTRFDESIGPSESAYAMGSETEFVRRLLRRGQQAGFVPDAVVEHFIRESQMSRSWILNRAVRFGRGQYRLALKGGLVDPELKKWRGVPRYLFLQAAQQMRTIAIAAVTGREETRFRAEWELKFISGSIQEAYQAARAASPTGGENM